MKKIHFVLAAMLLIALTTPALAQIQPGAYSLSPFVGGFWFESNQDLKSMPVYGLRLGKDFTKNWGAELVFDYVNTKYRSTDSYTNVYNYRIEALYHFMPDSKLVPFLAAGVGGMSINSKGDEGDKTRFTPAYGAGLKYFVTDWLALRADVRHVLGLGSVYNNLEYGLGLTFYFGGAKPAAAPVVAAKPAEEPRKPEAAAPAVVAAPRWNKIPTMTVYRIPVTSAPEHRQVLPSTRMAVRSIPTRTAYRITLTSAPEHRQVLPSTRMAVRSIPTRTAYRITLTSAPEHRQALPLTRMAVRSIPTRTAYRITLTSAPEHRQVLPSTRMAVRSIPTRTAYRITLTSAPEHRQVLPSTRMAVRYRRKRYR